MDTYIKAGVTMTAAEIMQLPENAGIIFSVTGSTFAERGWAKVPDPGPTLAAAKVGKRAEIDMARAIANSGFFVYAGVKIACDPVSMQDFDKTAQHIALTGSFHPAFPCVWKGRNALTDAVAYLSLASPADFIAMHAAMVQAGTDNFVRSEELKVAIEQATTIEAVQAIIW